MSMPVAFGAGLSSEEAPGTGGAGTVQCLANLPRRRHSVPTPTGCSCLRTYHPPADPDTPAKLPAEEAALYECVRLEVSDVAAYVADGDFDWQEEQPGTAAGEVRMSGMLEWWLLSLVGRGGHAGTTRGLANGSYASQPPPLAFFTGCLNPCACLPPCAGRPGGPAHPAAQPHRHEHCAAGKVCLLHAVARQAAAMRAHDQGFRPTGKALLSLQPL